MDMSFNWIRDWDNQKHFQVYLSPSSQNLGGYYTKPHQATHHNSVREIYIQRKIRKTQERGIQEGCVDPSGPRNARAAALLSGALTSTGLQTRSLRVNNYGKVFKFIPHIPMWTQ